MSAQESVRIDVWLWRARFFKTRSLAARFVDEGRVRLTRGGAETRLDKSSRTVRPGDVLVFALAGRLVALEVTGLGERRGPASEARALYTQSGGVAEPAIDTSGSGAPCPPPPA